MLLWGMESHSMFVSLWQLLLRPGYFIKDYLNGRRQVSYPPVKMLFVVSLIYLIFRQLLDMLFPGAPVVESVPEDLSESVIETAHTWITENPGYGMMTMTLILILPTWFFFRYAPRHPRHTFPEGFFIQIFMSSLMILIIFINRVTDKWFFWLVPLYYFIAYRQLFGYGIWATIWRLLLSFVFWMVSLFFFIFSYILVKTDDFWQALAAMLSVLGILLAILVLGYLFEHRNRRNLPFKQDR